MVFILFMVVAPISRSLFSNELNLLFSLGTGG